MQEFKVTESGKRLDVFVHDQLPKVSRSFASRLCEQGKVSVSGEQQKPSYKTKANDVITVDFDPKVEVHETIDLPILYEDDNVTVINKPSGILSHSKGAFNPEATVATFMSDKLQDNQGERGGIVHRLDRATSGVMICAKNQKSQDWLQKQFAERKTQKTYVAVISGTISPTEAIIDMPIERNPGKPKTFHVASSGRPAITHYKVLETNDRYTLLELHPKTGRTHQLRVHLQHLKKPIVGDEFYGGEQNERLLLHAHKLKIMLPDRATKEFIAEIPPSFHTILHDV